MKLLLCAVSLVALTVGATGHQPQKDNPNRLHQLRELKKIKLNIKGRTFEIWLMDSQSKITEGMMWLGNKDVKANQGMLFVFPDSRARGFWMANCPLGLDIAFMDPKGKILNIQNGKPFNETSLPSNGSSQYVLEVKAGTLKKIGVRAGDTIKIPRGLTYKG